MEKWLVAVEIVVGIATLITMIVGAVGGVIASGAAKVLEEGATVADEGANTAVELPNLANTDPVPPAQNQATYGPALMGLIKAGSTADQIGALVTRANGCIAAGVIGGILGATATTIVPFLPDIAEGKYDNTPKVTDLANAAVGKTIIWPSSVGGYTLQNATLNGVLQFGLS